MPVQYCFLCASDEGIFLDITPDNQKAFDDQLETCLAAKITENIELSNKICYKCAYELDQCTKFVKKYKDSHEILNSNAPESTCCLCLETSDSYRTFDITKDNRAIFSPLQKIRNIFNEDLTKKDDNSKLICLTCRYNLDVLYDLKKIYQETFTNLKALINKDIDYSSFPKVNTDVVNRKTTVTTFPDITFYASLSSDSEDNKKMPRNKSRVKNHNAQSKSRNIKTKVRICDECHNIVEKGNDMYRFHRTGLTVCKTCWLTMDPNKSKGKRRSRNNTQTKLCTVFLTDVLSDGSYKSEKMYKMEKDEDDNKLYLISDDSIEDRSSESSTLSTSPKDRHTINVKKQGRKREIDTKSDIESTPSKMSRSRNTIKKISSDREQSSNGRVTRQGRKKTSIASSDSDTSQLTLKKTHVYNLNDSAKSASSVESSTSKKRQRSEAALHLENTDESSSENSHSRKKKIVNTQISSTIKSEVEIKREARTRMRSSSISSTETPLIEFKSPKSKEVKNLSEVKMEYVCDKCSKKFDNKVSSAEHKLTHLKQVALKLERVNIDGEEKRETKTDSQKDEISKEIETEAEAEAEAEACCSRTVSVDKHSDDPSEEIAINIEDDTDDEEIFSHSKKSKRLKSESEESEESEKADAADKLETESQRAEEKSTETVVSDKYSKDVAKESEQHEESKTASDKSITPSEIEEKDQVTQIESINSESTLKDEDRKEKVASAEDDQEAKECEKIQTENDPKESIEEKEKQSVSECNEETENVQKTTTHDDKMVESSVHNMTKDQDEEPKHNCVDSKDKKMEDVEIIQDNLKNESRIENNDEKDTEKSEEKNKTMLDIVDKIKVSNDEKDSDDVNDEIKLAASEQQQNGDDAMSKKIVDKPNGTEGIVKSNFLNCETLDKTANVEDDNNDIEMISSANNNETAKVKRLTEEETLKDDLKENRRLEDDVTIFEKLIKETVTSEESEPQENSNHATSKSSPTDTANEILSEVFDLAAAEVQKREDNKKNLDDNEVETLENISREIRNSADMPSLDPISVVELNDDDSNGITLD